MVDYSRAGLVAGAGVDPWALGEKIGSGRPDAIRQIGKTFRDARSAAVEVAALGEAADRALAGAFLNNQQPVHDVRGSQATMRSALSDNGELMEEAARIMVDVGDGLGTAISAVDRIIRTLGSDVNDTVERRNSFMAANAATLTPEAARIAEDRFFAIALGFVRDHTSAVQREIDDYQALMINRTGRLRDLGYEGTDRRARRPLPEIEAGYQVSVDPGGVTEVPGFGTVTASEQQLLADLVSRRALIDPLDPGAGAEAVLSPFIGIKTEAEERARAVFPGDQNDSHADAFRHAYWNALLTREFGERFAEDFTTAHERRPADNPLREAMDLYNNEAGRRIAVEHPDAGPEELTRLVTDAVRDGDTVVIGGDRQLAYSDSVPLGGTGEPAVVPAPAGRDPRPLPQPLSETGSR